MNKIISIVIIVLIVVVGVGIYMSKTKNQTSVESPTPAHIEGDGHTTEEHMTKSMMHDTHKAVITEVSQHGAKLAGTRIDVQNINNLKPGNVTLAFKYYGSDGHEFGPNDLKVAHDKLMHLILVRDDATGFQHVHPEYVNGRWTTQVTIAEQGQYNMYVDAAPKEEATVILFTPLTIGGKTTQAKLPSVSADMSSVINGVQAKLTPVAPLKTKEHTRLTFALTRNGQPVANIDPYLGAFGHVVVLRHGDAYDYLHAHPITETRPTNGQVEFEAEFPAQGTYTLYAQFQIGGTVTTFPITLTVNQEGVAPAGHESGEHAH